MTSDKKSIALLTEIFVKKGLKHIVISPGSRNAPIIISFANHPDIEALSIVDERSAAFFALGMAQSSGKTVAIACTSGTAALNYAPAIAEAYYQKIPLLVLTADRPPDMIDIGDGQTIRQKDVYSNYIKGSFELRPEIETGDEISKAAQIINEAIDMTMFPSPGPVHINIPFAEPIYNQVERSSFDIQVPPIPFWQGAITDKEIEEFSDMWNKSGRKLIIAGMMNRNEKLAGLLKKLTEDESVFLLSETTSNIPGKISCTCIDKLVSTITPGEAEEFQPDLLVTFGGHIVSKMIKKFLRENKPKYHWHIDPVDINMDTYGCLTSEIATRPAYFFERLLPALKPLKSNFRNIWQQRSIRSEKKHIDFLSAAPYSDLKVFETLLQNIPADTDLHLGNSTPVRYTQLFKPFKSLNYFSNRGVSGIDGTVSTAAGAAFASGNPTTLITGDLAFFYDSNALMNNNLPGNLRIIVINNSGGGIFRFIPGPDTTGKLEKFFEAKHNLNAKHIANNFGVPYYSAGNITELNDILKEFYAPQNNKPAILEIFTPNESNAEVLRDYFLFLKGS